MMLFCKCYSDDPRQWPMYCKILIEVTKTSPHNSTNHNALQVLNRTRNQFANALQVLSRRHKDNRRCIARSQQNHKDNRRFIARSLQMSQRQSPMYCKLSTDVTNCLLYTSPSPRDQRGSRMPSSA